MVRVLIVLLSINLGVVYLAARSYQQNKLAQAWSQAVALQASLQRAQTAWLQDLDFWLALPVLTPEACHGAPCLLETQSVQEYATQPISFWEHTMLAITFEDTVYAHKTYAIFEVMPCKESEKLLRGTFVAVNEQGMQLRSQLVAQQNIGQVSLRYVMG